MRQIAGFFAAGAAAAPQLRRIFVGGEAVPAALLAEIMPALEPLARVLRGSVAVLDTLPPLPADQLGRDAPGCYCPDCLRALLAGAHRDTGVA